MSATEIKLWGGDWPIEILLLDGSGDPATGLAATTLLSIRRNSDDFFYDFNDDTFKASGWTTFEVAVSEISATNAAGEYEYDWDTDAVTNEVADDTYIFRVRESSGGAANVPQLGNIQADGWVKDIRDDVVELNDTKLTTARAGYLDELSAANLPADVDTLLSRVDVTLSTALATLEAHGDSTWATAVGFTVPADLVGLATLAGQAAIIVQGDAAWATATGFATPTNVTDARDAILTQGGAGPWTTADVSALATTAGLAAAEAAIIAEVDANEVKIDAIISTGGAGPWTTAVVAGLATSAEIAALEAHGDSTWATAVGFAVAGDAMTLTAGERTAVATEVWSTLLPGAFGAGTAGYILGTNLDTALAAAVTNIISEINANETKIDTIISTGGSGPWTTASLTGIATSAELAALESHGDSTWATATGFSTHSAADVDTQLSGTHGAGSWTTAVVAGLATSAEIAALQSHGDSTWATATGFAVPGDAMTLTAGERSAIDAALSAAHGAGSWQGDSAATIDALLTVNHGVGSWQQAASAGDWTATEKEQIRFRLAMDGTQTDPTTNTGTIEDVLADTDSLDTTKLTTARANNLDEITATRLAELDAANLPADVASVLSTGGAGPWTTATGFATLANLASLQIHGDLTWATATGFATPANLTTLQSNLESYGDSNWATATGFAVPGDNMGLTAVAVDLIWNELRGGSRPVGSFGYYLDAAVSTAGSPAAIAAAVWGEPLPGAYGAGTAGYVLGTNLDAVLSAVVTSIIAEIDANEVKLDTVISTGGIGPWTSANVSALATSAEIAALETHGDLVWATATGFATPTNVTDARDVILTQGGPGTWTTAVVAGLATSVELAALETHGDLTWATATGFATPTNVTDARDAIITQGDLAWATATGFSTPADVASAQAAIQVDIAALNDPSATDIANSVWLANLTAHSNMSLAGGMVNLLRKGLTNRLELSAGNPGFLKLYNDNDTLLLTWDERNAAGAGFILNANSPARRTKAT